MIPALAASPSTFAASTFAAVDDAFS